MTRTYPPAHGSSPLAGTHLVVGPERHGVVIHARRLAEHHPGLQQRTVWVERLPDPHGLPPGPVLLPFTDRLFGTSPEEAAAAVVRLGRERPLALALHDLPQPEEGEAWYRRRVLAYRRVVAAASVVVVASRFERDVLRRVSRPFGLPDLRAVPLPLEPEYPLPRPARTEPPFEVAVLGFLYPGKGIEDVVDAVASAPSQVPRIVTIYGAVAAGNADYADELEGYARDRHVTFRVTGFVPERNLVDTLRHAGVPVAPHRHVSASGSIGSWLAAGRRPIVRDGGYARELAARLPGSISATRDLAAALVTAMTDPDTTWLAPTVRLGPSWSEAAAAHVDLLDDVARRVSS